MMGKAPRPFEAIYAAAAKRKGGPEALERLLAQTPSVAPDAIAAIGDDRLLAEMTRRVFQAGFSHALIARKWPDFEVAFEGFDIARCAFLSDDDIHILVQNERIVRNGTKIRSVQKNAVFLQELALAHGSAARFIADWPSDDFIGLVETIRKGASHLGGDSSMRFLRALGKPAFITTPDVVTALIREDVIDKAPSSKRAWQAVQQAFNAWSIEAGRDLTAVSRVLSMSVATPAEAEAAADAD